MFGVEIHVHHGMTWPIVHKPNSSRICPVVHLQCQAGIHFNPIVDTRRKISELQIDDKYINYSTNEKHDGKSCSIFLDTYDFDSHEIIIYNATETKWVHSTPIALTCTADVFDVQFCALVNTSVLRCVS